MRFPNWISLGQFPTVGPSAVRVFVAMFRDGHSVVRNGFLGTEANGAMWEVAEVTDRPPHLMYEEIGSAELWDLAIRGAHPLSRNKTGDFARKLEEA